MHLGATGAPLLLHEFAVELGCLLQCASGGHGVGRCERGVNVSRRVLGANRSISRAVLKLACIIRFQVCVPSCATELRLV